jgi:large subunit ribosomal protein L16
MLMPKRVKRRKQHLTTIRGRATIGNTIAYGEYGLVALEPGRIKSNQIEAARVAMTRYIKRGGRVWVNIFPHMSVTKKPADTRMGSGKGSPEYWIAVVKPDRILFEMSGIPENEAREALRLAGHKLPIKSKFVKKTDMVEQGGEE